VENNSQAERGSDGLDLRFIEGIERWILLTALVLAAASLVLWQTAHGVASVATGGLIAFLDFLILRRTTTGIFEGSQRKRAALGVALMLKMGLLLAAVWAAVSVLGFDPVGVGLGVSALVIGIVGGTLFTPQESNDQAQPEQRGFDA
jgi:hypothetical protein